jgi:colanic acid/amylovoran biosynthesis glycosyltransferase
VNTPVNICYIVNQYPKVSHSFIRREILELENQGARVLRISMRGWKDLVVDPLDREEQARTRYVLAAGAVGLMLAAIAQFVRNPLRMGRAMIHALRMTRHSDRPFWVHVIYLAEACVAARWLRADGSRHIHAHFGTNPAEVALLASLLTAVPFSFTVHGPEEFDRPRGIGLPRKIRQASRVVAISSYGRSQLYRWADPVAWQKIRVVHCGLDAMYMSAPPDQAPSADTLVCIGRLCEQKGQLILLQALRRVIDRGSNCRVVFAGDGEMRQLVESSARSLGLTDRIRITGWIDSAQVREEILRARAMVLPSFAEGLPVVIMEALALARPVISTYVAGIPELVEDGVNGWLVPAGDVERLADAMIGCLAASDADVLAMGRSGRQRVLQRHDIRTSAEQLLKMFQEES